MNSGKDDGSRDYHFFSQVAQMSVNKEHVAHALRNNKQLQPHGRNGKEIDPATTEPNTGFSLTSASEQPATILSWEHKAKRSRFHEAANNRANKITRIPIKYDEDGNVLYPEPDCSFKASSVKLVNNHIHARFPRRFTGQDPHSCPLCGKLVKSLRPHLDAHYSDGIPCPHCDLTFTNKENQKAHVKDYHEKQERKAEDFTCEICGKVSGTRKAHTAHLHIHNNVMEQCPNCDKIMERQKLPCHICYHCTGTVQKMGQCHICGAKHHVSKMANHIAKAHKEADEILTFAKRANITGDDGFYTEEYMMHIWDNMHRTTSKFVEMEI
ncbi:distal enhancer DNA-binding transcription repressor activity, RNA polymerase II-specific [Diplodia intermedia]|uniref:Distal enhancer DNA-binding transcription repressor activity, RNA polymerase II-specific n=1 Tax=Diplodia intermedia TaxID=856260 RepID=A0ABR3TSS2_9PEZI